MTDSNPKDTFRQRCSDEAWELAEKYYDLRNADERPDYLGGPRRFWEWLLQEIKQAESAARRDPREARRFAAKYREILDNHPNMSTRLVEVEGEKKRHNQNAVLARRYKRVPAETESSVGCRLHERLFLDAAEHEEKRIGCDDQGQMQIGGAA